MNERIIELIEESKCLSDGYNIGAVDLEKFAELIVRECAELNFRELGLSGSSSFDVSRMIKQHFGVEE
jgi:hypothetical protein